MAGPSGPMIHDDAVGHAVRAGGWPEQGESTYRLAAAALEEGRFADAAALGRYTVEEAREGHELYAEWSDQIREYLRDEGVSEDDLEAEAARLAALLRLPDGGAFDAAAGWAGYLALIDRFAAACEAGDGEAAQGLLDEARETWRVTHDRACDQVYGWLDVVTRRLGEARIGPLWDALMAPMYETYDRYDIDAEPWSRSFTRLMMVALESLRGHLSGPGRMGSVEVFEEADRWALRFDPCGSGGRTYRDDAEGGPRMVAPYDFAVTTERHDWAWNKTGVCVYCVHCCQLNQRMPMRRFGYPTRVVDPPTWPAARDGGKCTWYVYKDPSLVPEDVYTQVGNDKPARLGGAAQMAAAGLADG